MLLTLVVLLAVILSAATIVYLSNTAEFSRKDEPAATTPGAGR
ncbi:hypothetical protein OKA04_12000 [Luteolibacter flavescens]|uniref:Uncharacterized protein n=1 Tax=Luteolibacter flavescens TaxID=1859460 RepID=A0ABT3FQI9_9BACT|nr:hypothetical protein [Luteolibacter flavescens]MCW1885454.1 hypothetical protein [Luteolibacter flavescens]